MPKLYKKMTPWLWVLLVILAMWPKAFGLILAVILGVLLVILIMSVVTRW